MSWRKATLCSVSKVSHQIPLSHTDLDSNWGGLLHKNPANSQVFSKQRLCNYSNIEVFHLFAVKVLFCLLAASCHPQKHPGWLLLRNLAMCIHLPGVLVTKMFAFSVKLAPGSHCLKVLLSPDGVWRVQDCLGYGLSGLDGWCRTNLHFFPSLMRVCCLLVKLPVSQNELF